MKKKKTKLANTAEVTQNEAAPENSLSDKKTFLTPKRVETIVAILLGVTTLLSAWASWIGHLHGGIQSINFTKSNNMASQGTAAYNICMQAYLADLMAWNNLREYNYELELAKAEGNQTKIDLVEKKIESFKKENFSTILIEGFEWMEENNEDNPFKMPGLEEKYFEEAEASVNQSQELLEEGKRDNTKGDSYLLVTVIYSMTLFLLGIVNTFKNMPNKITVLGIACVFLVFGIIYMCTIPLPTGFDKMNFFDFK